MFLARDRDTLTVLLSKKGTKKPRRNRRGFVYQWV
jgi:hypothetical protein